MLNSRGLSFKRESRKFWLAVATKEKLISRQAISQENKLCPTRKKWDFGIYHFGWAVFNPSLLPHSVQSDSLMKGHTAISQWDRRHSHPVMLLSSSFSTRTLEDKNFQYQHQSRNKDRRFRLAVLSENYGGCQSWILTSILHSWHHQFCTSYFFF